MKKLRRVNLKRTSKNKINMMLYLLVCIFILSLTVGYAAINQDLKISGEATFRVEEDIRITNVELSETTNMGIENYTSKYGKDSITLGVDLKEINSTVTYNVQIINSGTIAMWIDSITQEINNNTNMEYVLEGIGIKELINPGETKDFKLTIKYKEGITLPEDINLDTMLRFDFVKPVSILAQGSNGDATTTFYNGLITKESVESIEFLPTLEVGEETIGSWDASYNKDGTVIAWYTDSDNNDLYELYIGGIGEVEAPIDSSSLFRNFSNVTSITFNDYFNTQNVTNMSAMFYYCSSLTSIDLSDFNTENVETMGYGYGSPSYENSGGMFNGCSSLISLDLSYFNTDNLKSMSNMFRNCSSLVELDVSNFNTSKITTFAGNSADWDGLFTNCSSLISLDLSNWDVSNIKSFSNMFSGCTSLITLNLSGWSTNSATNMNRMFYGCENLIELDLSTFNTPYVTNMANMFNNCSKLKRLNISTFNTQKVTSMNHMFYNCVSLKTLDLSNFSTPNLTNIKDMFRNCSSLVELDVSNFNTSKITTFVGDNTDWDGLFTNCSSLISLDLSNWDVSNVKSFSNMFSGCTSLITLNLSGWSTNSATDMNRMFYGCSSLLNLDIRNFDFTNVNSIGLDGTPSNITIYVKDGAAKEVILNSKSDANVIIPESI